jgi:hypothetical protein
VNKITSGAKTTEEASLKLTIEGIRTRQKRADELDEEKVYARVLIDMQKMIKLGKAISSVEEIAVWWMLIDKSGFHPKVEKHLGIDISSAKNFDKIYERLQKLTPEEKSFIIRESFQHNYGSNAPRNMYALLFKRIAMAHGVPVEQYTKEQDEIAVQRKKRAEDRIEAMKKQIAGDKKKPVTKGKGLAALLPDATPKPKASKKAVRKPREAAYMKPMNIGEALQPIVGSKPLARTEVVKKIWEYIKKNKLQDTKERRNINTDETLQKVFGGKKVISMFEMSKQINNHLS